MNPFYYAFMAEAEGLTDTRVGRLNAAINEMQELGDYDEDILFNHNIDPSSLTKKEIKKIKRGVYNE